MLELDHSVNSACAQKVRIAGAGKGLGCTDHPMTLRGEQFAPEYMKLKPNAVVPTLRLELLRMLEDQAPFRNLGIDPWPKVEALLWAS